VKRPVIHVLDYDLCTPLWTSAMSENTDAHIAAADVLTLLLHNQHALAAAIEEVALWAKGSGSSDTHDNVVSALQTLDANASAITAGIFKLRQ
jgi:hypothetical protein